MTLATAMLLACVQGLTEFLPVSSSGHLVIAQQLLGLSEPQLLFDIVVHVGTLGAILIYFWRDIIAIGVDLLSGCVELAGGATLSDALYRNPRIRLVWYLVIGSIPAALVGFLWADAVEPLFGSLRFVGAALIVTGLLLWCTKSVHGMERDFQHFRWRDALVIGLFQAGGLLPGISRAGATIAAGLFRGLEKDLIARYSFLLAVPATIGSVLLKWHAISSFNGTAGVVLWVSVFTSLCVGYIALRFCVRFLLRGQLFSFAYYCLPVGLVTLIASFF